MSPHGPGQPALGCPQSPAFPSSPAIPGALQQFAWLKSLPLTASGKVRERRESSWEPPVCSGVFFFLFPAHEHRAALHTRSAFPASLPHPCACFPRVPAQLLGCRGPVVEPVWAQGFPVALRWNFHCVWVVLTSLIHRLGRGSAFPSFPRGSGQDLAPVGISWSRTCAHGPSTQGPM